MNAHVVLVVLIGFVLQSTASAAEPASRDLFNGKDLDGWIVTNCEAVVREGVLVLAAGNGFVQTKDRFRNFVLEVEWKAGLEQKYDSGIFIRCEPPAATGRPWPIKYQINLRKGAEGDLLAVASGGRSKGLIKEGNWNHFRLTVEGKKARMQINGRDAWTADGIEALEGHIGLQAEVPAEPFEFRKIRLSELPNEK